MNHDEIRNEINQRHSIVAILVLYQHTEEVLDQILDALISQVSSIVVINNGPRLDATISKKKTYSQNIEFLQLDTNLGIAAAQNIGINWARNRKANFVLLMDQDSIPAHDMVERLVYAISQQVTPAAVGPRYLDDRLDKPMSPFFRHRGLRLERCTSTNLDSVIEVDFLISSGSLIPISVLDVVGGMREDLFIDYVDTEWVWRASHHGFKSYGVYSANMMHNLGDQSVKFFGKNVTLHSPLRHYYFFRNAFILYKESWIPFNYKLVDLWRLCFKFIVYSLIARPRLTQCMMMTFGMWHGLIGKTGKFKGSSI